MIEDRDIILFIGSIVVASIALAIPILLVVSIVNHWTLTGIFTGLITFGEWLSLIVTIYEDTKEDE